MKARIMKLLKLKTAVLAIAFSAVSSLAGHAESHTIRNCTWCHGTSAQGYLPAPRLAGQQRQYFENQLVGFRKHARDNPFSKQYMWFATENLGPQTAHDLAVYFSKLTPADRPKTEISNSWLWDGRYIKTEFQIPILSLVLPATARTPRALEKFLVWEASRFLTCKGGSNSGAKDIIRLQGFRCRTLRANCLLSKLRRLRHTSVLLSD